MTNITFEVQRHILQGGQQPEVTCGTLVAISLREDCNTMCGEEEIRLVGSKIHVLVTQF